MTNEIHIQDEYAAAASKHDLYRKLPYKKVRAGWRESAEAIARDGDDDLLLNQFPNTRVNDLDW